MEFLTSFLLVIHFLLLFTPKIAAQFAFLDHWCGNTTYTANSTYQSNLNQVLNSLSSDTHITYGFYNFTAGQPPDKVEATGLCRGDVPTSTCRDCLQSSVSALPLACPNQKEAFGYSTYCVIFVSNGSIFHQVHEGKPHITLRNNRNISDVPGFNHTLYDLLGKLIGEASLGNSQLKYATGKVGIPGNRTLYGLVQCNPDLSRGDCVKCVKRLMVIYPTFVSMPTFIAAGARTTSPSCNLRYEIYSFYGNVSDLASPPPTQQPNLSPPGPSNELVKKHKKSYIAIIIISILGSIVLILAVFVIWRRKKLWKRWAKFEEEETETLESLKFSLETIKIATEDFADENKLGEGGFGTVYKGTLVDGQKIAAKRLSSYSGQGDKQFKNEILTLAKLKHRNLVRLLGFCMEGEEMILVYEFVTNGSLDKLSFDPLLHASSSWETRWKIINGIARGLLYLHEESRLRIIHRDLKAGNVLLDADFNPKIADFGMARLFNMDQTQAVASRIVGTYGYMPPEYVLHGRVSVKLDVFSFGVLVLEIISGQTISTFKIGENQSLLSFAWKNWMEGTAWNLVDHSLPTAFSTEILRCIHIGLLCVQYNPAERPNMSSVALMLSSESLTLKVPSQPAFFNWNNEPSNLPNTGSLAECSVNEVSFTDPYPR